MRPSAIALLTAAVAGPWAVLLGGCGGANGAGTDAAFGQVLFDCQVESLTSSSVFPGSDGNQAPPLRRRLDLLEHSASYLAIEAPSARDVLASPEDLTRPVALPVGEYVARIGWRSGPGMYTWIHGAHGGATRRFVVRENATTLVRLVAGAGGVIEVENGRDQTLGALEIIDAGGRRFAVERAVWRLGWATAQHRRDCPARETRRFLPLPAGRQRIAGWIGDERFERTIVLADGEVTRVALD